MAIVNHFKIEQVNCTLCGEHASPPYMTWRAETELNICAQCCARSAEAIMKDLIVMKAQYQISQISGVSSIIVKHEVEEPITEKEWFANLHKECARKMAANITNLAVAKPKA